MLRRACSGLLLASALALFAATASIAGTVTASTGDVQIVRNERSLPAAVGTALVEGDIVLTGSGAETLLTFESGARMLVRPQSRLHLIEFPQAGRPTMRDKTIRIVRGSMRYVSGKAIQYGRVRFETRGVSVGIRGTDIELSFSEEQGDARGTYLRVNSGQAFLSALDGTTVDLEAGQVAHGALPGLRTRSPGDVPEPAAQRVEQAPAGVFGTSGSLEDLMR